MYHILWVLPYDNLLLACIPILVIRHSGSIQVSTIGIVYSRCTKSDIIAHINVPQVYFSQPSAGIRREGKEEEYSVREQTQSGQAEGGAGSLVLLAYLLLGLINRSLVGLRLTRGHYQSRMRVRALVPVQEDRDTYCRTYRRQT